MVRDDEDVFGRDVPKAPIDTLARRRGRCHGPYRRAFRPDPRADVERVDAAATTPGYEKVADGIEIDPWIALGLHRLVARGRKYLARDDSGCADVPNEDRPSVSKGYVRATYGVDGTDLTLVRPLGALLRPGVGHRVVFHEVVDARRSRTEEMSRQGVVGRRQLELPPLIGHIGATRPLAC